MIESKEAVLENITKILGERGRRYGKFKDHATLSQHLKRVVHLGLSERGKYVDDDQQEALDMICHKIARIVNGDPDYVDSWDDIAGYAILVANRLRGAEQ